MKRRSRRRKRPTGSGGSDHCDLAHLCVRRSAVAGVLCAFLVVVCVYPQAIEAISIQQQAAAAAAAKAMGSGGQQQQQPLIKVKQVVIDPLAQVAPIQFSSREIEKQIVDRILGEGYDKRIRPAGSGLTNTSKPGK